MDENLTINTPKNRIEKIKDYLNNNRKKIITIILTIILILVGYFVYLEINKKNKIKIANNYNKAKINYISGDKSNVKNELINIVNEKDKTYSPLALYFLIDNKILVDKNKINKFFDILINKTDLEKEIKNLVIYKKAVFNSDFETENNLIKILNPIINSNSIWKAHSLYLMAEYFYFKNEKEKSKEFFNQILNLENVNPSIKLEAQRRLNRDFSD